MLVKIKKYISILNDSIDEFRQLYWVMKLFIFVLITLITIYILVSLSATLGCILLGIEIGLSLGIVTVTRLSERVHMLIIGIVVTLIINGILFGDISKPVSKASVGNFLANIISSFCSSLQSTGLTAPSSYSLAIGLWVFFTVFGLCILFSLYRDERREPKDIFATCNFNQVSRGLVSALIGEWHYLVYDHNDKKSHEGKCSFSKTGSFLQLSGTRKFTHNKDGSMDKCNIPWHARFIIYTNSLSGRFLRFEYGIRLKGLNIEAYSKLNLKDTREGVILGTYDHLAGGEATGRIEFQALRLSNKVSKDEQVSQ